MSEPLRIALVQQAFPAGAIERNRERIAAVASELAARDAADLVVFPALALTGRVPPTLAGWPDFMARVEAARDALLPLSARIPLLLGLADPVVAGGRACLLRDGKIEAATTAEEPPCRFALAGVPVEAGIGADLVRPGRTDGPAPRLRLQLADRPFLQEPFRAPLAPLREALRGRDCAAAWLNLVGGQDAAIHAGGAFLLDADGAAHPPATAFSEQVLLAEFDPATGRCTPRDWQLEPEADEPTGLLWRALVRATGDYVRGSGGGRAWIGLSGGLDSALVLALAVDALGADAVTAVFMPSLHTSALSGELAHRQADALGVHLETVPIAAPFDGFRAALAPAFAGRDEDVTEENLQARSRGTLLMALSNKFGGVVLATGNKSEFAVGYSTLYGDMCGAFAPLKDVYKTGVRRLAQWRNRGAAAGREPIPPAVIARPPTAELRPGQADTDSLPPYEVLDALLDRLVAGGGAAAGEFDAQLVRRVTRLLLRSSFKRAQAPPGPTVSASPLAGLELPLGSTWDP